MIKSTRELPISATRSKAVHALLTAAPLDALLAAARRVGRYTAELIRQRALRQAETELMTLDDRMLRDIGLSRRGISSAVRHARQEPNGAQNKRDDATLRNVREVRLSRVLR